MDQLISLMRLRILVTARSYTKTASSRVESYFFFPLFILAMLTVYRAVPQALELAAFYIPAHVMMFNYFFLSLAIIWIMIPFMGFRLNESLDIRRLIHFPITFPTLYLALTVGNFIDISSLVPVAFLAALSKFMYTHGETSSIIGVLILCIIFFMFLQLIYQTVMLLLYNLLPRINPVKIAAFCLAGLIVFTVLINFGIFEMPNEMVFLNDENLSFHNLLPTGWFGIAAYEFFIGNDKLAWSFVLKCALILIPLLVINGLFTWMTFRGYNQGLMRGKASKLKSASLLDIPGLIDRLKISPTLTIAAKDAQTFLRDWHFMFYKLMPGIVTPTLILLIVRYSITQEGDSLPPEWSRVIYITFMIMVLVLFMAQAYVFVGNIFGFDRVAVGSIFTAPVTDREILIGKNLFMFVLLSIDSLVISCLSYLFFRNVVVPLSMFVFLESVVVIMIGLGNICSMIFPYYVPFDRPTVSFQGTLIVGIMNMATDLCLGVLMIPVIIMLVASFNSGTHLWLLLILPLSLVYSLAIYFVLLKFASDLMPRYRENIYQNVTSM